jgi:thymidylate kinase
VSPTLQPLPRSLALFRHFDESGVAYCHFKSNEHLLAGLAGATDLDLLVARQQARAAQAALERAGFKRFDARFAAEHPALEDYLGFDAGTGKLIHAHVYYALVVGERHLKGYQLDFDGQVLATRIADAATGVYTSDPSYEMLLLLIRYALKARLRDCVRESLGGRPVFGADARLEHAWLQQRLQRDRVRALTVEHFGEAAGRLIDALVASPPSVWQLAALRRRAAAALARQRSFGVLESIPVRLGRELSWLVGGLNRRVLHLPVPLRRTHPAGGRIVVLLGPDGSGKSTVAREVRHWLAWKLDVYPVYFGSGDGPASLARWPLKLALRLRGRRARSGPASAAPARAASNGRAAHSISPARALWALVLAAEKRSKMRACVKARNRGMIVVCDRYPQAQVAGFNDGPLLSPWLAGRWALQRRLARWELETYLQLARTTPDLVVKLDVTPEAGLSRSPDTAPGEIERRREAVAAIDYGPGSRTLAIDAMRPLADVLLDVKRAVWDQL